MAEHVLVVLPQPPDGRLGAGGGEALGAGRQLASAFGVPLACAVLGHDVEAAIVDAGERGAVRVLVADGEQPARLSGDIAVALAAEAVRLTEARVVLIARGPHALELAPRLAARLDGGSVMGVIELRPGDGGELEVVASVFGGAARAVYRFGAEGPRIVGLAPMIAAAPPREPGRTAELVTLEVAAAADRVRVLKSPVASEGPRLEDARIVVGGGRGLRQSENYTLIRELAAALGGMPGASRPIVDEGWAEQSEQIGLTGELIAPDLYLAAGISGASQHMAGCSGARMIVAVNSDPQAPIFRHAHLGVVDDCLAILPELIRIARETGVASLIDPSRD